MTIVGYVAAAIQTKQQQTNNINWFRCSKQTKATKAQLKKPNTQLL